MLDIVRQRDEERRKLDPARWWKTPVSFYGRAVDQNGEPVPQADVKFELNDTSVRGTTDYSTKTDANGFFSLTGVKGKNLAVYITKAGYYQGRAENNNFDYNDIASGSQYKADPRHPEVFRLHKGGEKVALIKHEFLLRVKIGVPTTVDLLSGATNAIGGQLRFELLENERRHGGAVGGKWSMRLSVDNGGVQLNTEEFPFMAPESGYQPSIQLSIDSEKRPAWGGTQAGGDVFLSAQGLYAQVELRMPPGGGALELTYYVNPSGSRNLEPDSNLLFSDLESYKAYMAAHPQVPR